MVLEPYGLELERALRNAKLGQQLHAKKRKITFTTTDEANNCAVFVQRDNQRLQRRLSVSSFRSACYHALVLAVMLLHMCALDRCSLAPHPLAARQQKT